MASLKEAFGGMMHNEPPTIHRTYTIPDVCVTSTIDKSPNCPKCRNQHTMPVSIDGCSRRYCGMCGVYFKAKKVCRNKLTHNL